MHLEEEKYTLACSNDLIVINGRRSYYGQHINIYIYIYNENYNLV